MDTNPLEQDGIGAEMAALHASRTVVEGRDVDARLDSRSLDEMSKPKLPEGVDKPQHVSGPDLAGQRKYTADFLAAKAKRHERRRNAGTNPAPAAAAKSDKG